MNITRTLLLLITLLICGKAIAAPMDSVHYNSIDSNHEAYRHFIMPTGKGMEGGYIGAWELAFLQAGIGFDGVISLSGGFTLIPSVAFRSQFGFLQGKITLVDQDGFSFAAGSNYLRLTSEQNYVHLFGVATYELPSKARFTGLFFYKIIGNDFPIVNVVPFGEFRFSYGGSLGIGVGYDMPLPNTTNMRFVAEVWNHDISSPNKFAGLAALRVESDHFSSDFGLMYFTLPLIAPVANFVWRF